MKGSIFPGANFIGSGSVQCNVDSNINGNSNQASTMIAICPVPHTLQARSFYNIVVMLFANSGWGPQFYGIDFP